MAQCSVSLYAKRQSKNRIRFAQRDHRPHSGGARGQGNGGAVAAGADSSAAGAWRSHLLA